MNAANGSFPTRGEPNVYICAVFHIPQLCSSKSWTPAPMLCPVMIGERFGYVARTEVTASRTAVRRSDQPRSKPEWIQHDKHPGRMYGT
jgi:hypothetical protein